MLYMNVVFVLKRRLLLLFTVTASCVAVAQDFKKPVILGFYPDTSSCSVGGDYYLVKSSFKFFSDVPKFKYQPE